MKRRIRTHSTNQYYSDEPAVAKNLIADKPPVLDASLGNKTPKGVDKNPGRSSGLAGGAEHKRPKSHQFKVASTKVPPKVGGFVPSKLRMSGHPGAHRLGIKPLKKI